MFCCLSFGSLSVSGQPPLKSSDLTFCPLQKTWVEKYVPKPAVKDKEPLADICASDRDKQQFIFEVSRKTPLLRFVPNFATAEKLFFDYLEKGKQALALVEPRNAPERGVEKANSERKSAGSNFRTNFDETRSPVFDLPQAARPPTAQIVSAFERIAPRDLGKISRRISPRAPPAFSL